MGIMSSIYNSDFNIEQLFLGSEEITEMYLGDQLVFSKITNNLFYKLHEFVGSLTVRNTVEAPVKSAILYGSTKYKDVDTDEILETFEEGRNLELVSVKMPVLTTSNENGTKTNILTCNEEVELRGVGEVKDELNLVTGEYTKAIYEYTFTGDENWKLNGGANGGANGGYTYFSCNLGGLLVNYDYKTPANIPISCNRLPVITYNDFDDRTKNVGINLTYFFRLNFSDCDSNNGATVEDLKAYLKTNPTTVQYPISKSVKTVDLSSNKVYAYNGTTHYTCSSEEGSLIPTACIEVPVETEAVE